MNNGPAPLDSSDPRHAQAIRNFHDLSFSGQAALHQESHGAALSKWPIQSIRLDPTNRCNQGCIFCRYHGQLSNNKSPRPRDLPLPVFERMIRDLDLYGFHPQIRFVGSGEPTLHPQFDQMLLTAKEHGMTTKLVTNGSQLGVKREILAGYLDFLCISLHGLYEVHDHVTGRIGAFGQIMRDLTALMSAPNRLRKVMTHTTMTPFNADQLEELIAIDRTLGVLPEFLHLTDTEENFTVMRSGWEDVKRAIRKIMSNYPDIRFWPNLSAEEIDGYYDVSSPFRRNVGGCRRIFIEANVMSDGQVTLCMESPIGALAADSIIDILDGPARGRTLASREDAAARNELFSEFCSRCFSE